MLYKAYIFISKIFWHKSGPVDCKAIFLQNPVDRRHSFIVYKIMKRRRVSTDVSNF